MPNHILVACPSCQSRLRIRPSYIGLDLQCKHCEHQFAPSLGDVVDPIASHKASSLPAAVEKFITECPGCRRVLKIRPQYLGEIVTCKRCDRSFVALSRSVDDASRALPEEKDNSFQEENQLDRPISPSPGRIEGIAIHPETRDPERSERDPTFKKLVLDFERGRREFAALEASFWSLRHEVAGLRGAAKSQRGADMSNSPAELAAKLDEDRERARGLLEGLQEQIEQLRRENAGSVSGRDESETPKLHLESRLRTLEEATRRGIERASQFEERLTRIEGTEAEHAASREELERISGQQLLLGQATTEQAETLQAQLASIRAEYSSLRGGVEDNGQRQAHLESVAAGLESRGLDQERGLSAYRDAFEAGQFSIFEQINSLRDQFHLAFGDQAGRYRGLDSTSDQINAMKEENSFLREDLERIRLEQDTLKRIVIEVTDSVRSELVALRAELDSRTSITALSASISSGLAPRSVEVSLLPAASVVDSSTASPRSRLNELAQDLVLDRLFGSDDQSEGQISEGKFVTSWNGSAMLWNAEPKAKFTSLERKTEYELLSGQIAQLMNSADLGAALVKAGQLVSFTRDYFGEQSVEHAIWLRNLGMLFLSDKNHKEGRELLLRALKTSKVLLGSHPTPYAICLIDLADLYLSDGDRHQAKIYCKEASAILQNKIGSDHPLSRRARDSLARIMSSDPIFSSMNTISITTS